MRLMGCTELVFLSPCFLYSSEQFIQGQLPSSVTKTTLTLRICAVNTSLAFSLDALLGSPGGSRVSYVLGGCSFETVSNLAEPD